MNYYDEAVELVAAGHCESIVTALAALACSGPTRSPDAVRVCASLHNDALRLTKRDGK